jgi:ribosome assembly protein SQT1
MWNAEAALCMQVFVGHMGPVLCGLFADKYVCSGAEDGTVIVWSPKTGKPVQTLKGDKFHEGPVLCMAAHPEQPLLLTGSHDGSVFLSQLDNGKVPQQSNSTFYVESFNRSLSQVLTAFTGHKDSIESVGFCLQLPFCATGSLDGTAIVWDIKNRQQRCKLSHDAGVVKVKWHPTEPLLFTACIDGAMRLWDARNGALVRSWRGHQDQILDFVMTKYAAFFSSFHKCSMFVLMVGLLFCLCSDGKKLISCGDDQACLVFDIGTIDGKASS